MSSCVEEDSSTASSSNDDSGKIIIPDTGQDGFTFRKMWAFTGPGILLCIAYMDPGNIEADLQAGVQAQYKILWVLLGSTLLGLVMQRLSLRLGVVTGKHLAEMCYLQYPQLPRLFLWLMMEVAIIGSDMQEVIGTAIALYLLSNKLIPLWVGVVLTILDTFMFLLLDGYGLRKLEIFFAALAAIMVFTFGYEFAVGTPDGGQLLKGFVFTWCEGCDTSVMLQAIGIIGSVIMPHNLYLHSGLVKSRAIDRSKAFKVREANMFFFWECFVGLSLSLFINAMIMAVFAHGLYQKTNAELMSICLENGFPGDNVFANNSKIVDLDIYSGGIYLGCQYGVLAMYIWGVGVLAAGEGTTMTGCYAGQLAMEGFLHLKWSKWKRVLFTRSFAILPTFLVAFYSTISYMSYMNDILNAVMSVQIPFATLPLVAFTSNPRIMGEFVNSTTNKVSMLVASCTVIGINVYFVSSSWISAAWGDYILLTCLVLYSVVYFSMCIYLLFHTFASMTANGSSLSRIFIYNVEWRNEYLDFWTT